MTGEPIKGGKNNQDNISLLTIFGTVLSAPAPPVSLSLSGRNWVLLLLLLRCLTKLMLRPLGADGKVHKAIKQVHHLGKQPKEGGDDAAEKPKKNVNHSQLGGVVCGVVVVNHVKKELEAFVDCKFGKEVEVDCEQKAVDGRNSNRSLLAFPHRARAVRLLCTRVCSLLQEVEHAATPFQALKQNTLSNMISSMATHFHPVLRYDIQRGVRILV